MPNWSRNTIVIKGSKNAISDFIKKGLENSNVAIPETEDLQGLFNLLVEEGSYKTSISKDSFNKSKKTIVMEKGVTLRTFLPTPDTFLLYDTTNYPNDFKEIAEQQKNEYGCVGWYEYNNKTLGCKWDSQMTDLSLSALEDDTYIIKFSCNTPWCIPTEWCCTMKREFPDLSIFILAFEESNAYALYGEFGEDMLHEAEDRSNEISNLYPEYDEDDEDYDDKVEEATNRQMEIEDEMYDTFMQFVENN